MNFVFPEWAEASEVLEKLIDNHFKISIWRKSDDEMDIKFIDPFIDAINIPSKYYSTFHRRYDMYIDWMKDQGMRDAIRQFLHTPQPSNEEILEGLDDVILRIIAENVATPQEILKGIMGIIRNVHDVPYELEERLTSKL